ncbi:MAG: hypothetical protein WC457_04305 [Patescibacteria group bacterium]
MNNSLLNKGRWLWQKIKPRRRLGFVSIFLLMSVFLFAMFVVGIHPAYADFGSTLSEWLGNLVLGLAATFMSITVFILKFVIEIASYNHYINAPAVTLGWVLVRDVTNMFFVLILMVIAFGTVLGIEQYEWKKLLVKFVMAAILVNFSRLICGVIIDAAQVFMMTFISGAAATAGGNLVNALHMNDILAFATDADPSALSTDINVLVSAIVACIFAFTAMVVIGAYLLMLIARVIALWICIILSPLAFVLGVIPKFQSYASQWWTEFTNNVLSGPVLAFFLWLAFAVAGGANIHDEFTGANSGYPITDAETAMQEASTATGGEPSMNLNKVLQWENLANFILAAALLLAGVKTTQKLSAAGAGMLGAAAGAATKFAYAASGAAAGLAAAKWTGKTAKAVGKGIAMNVPLVGGNAWKERGENLALNAKLGMQAGKDFYNRQILERGSHAFARTKPGKFLAAAGGVVGLNKGDISSQFMIGTRAAQIKTKKDMLENRIKLAETSVKEPEDLKQKQADLKANVELGKLIKAGVIAKRDEQAWKNLEEKIAPDSKGRGEKLVDMAASMQAKADLFESKHKQEQQVRLLSAKEDVLRKKAGETGIGGYTVEADKAKAERLGIENEKMVKEAGGIDNLTDQQKLEFQKNKQFIDISAAQTKLIEEQTQVAGEQAKQVLLTGAGEESGRLEGIQGRQAELMKEKELITQDNRAIEEIRQLKRIEELLRTSGRMQDLNSSLHGNKIELDDAKIETDRATSELNAKSYEGKGRDDLARLEHAKFANSYFKKMQENFADYSYNDFATEAPAQFKRVQDAAAAYDGVKGTGSPDEAEKTKAYQKEAAKTASFVALSMRDASTYKAVEDAATKVIPYTGDRSPENRQNILASMISGRDMKGKNSVELNSELSGLNRNNQHQVNAMLKILQDNAKTLASKSGYASVVSGVKYDTVKGNYSLGYNKEDADYYSTHANMREATNAYHIIYQDKTGDLNIDVHNENAFISQVKNADQNNVGRVFLPALMADLNEKMEALDPAKLDGFLKHVAEGMTDDKALKILIKRMEKILKKSGKTEAEILKYWKDSHK